MAVQKDQSFIPTDRAGRLGSRHILCSRWECQTRVGKLQSEVVVSGLPASILDVRCSPCSYSNPVPWFFLGGVLLFLFFELCPQALLVCIQFVWPGRLCVVSLACAGRHMVDWGYSCWPSISLSQHMQIVMCTSKKLDRSLCWWDPAVPKCPLGHKQLNRS